MPCRRDPSIQCAGGETKSARGPWGRARGKRGDDQGRLAAPGAGAPSRSHRRRCAGGPRGDSPDGRNQRGIRGAARSGPSPRGGGARQGCTAGGRGSVTGVERRRRAIRSVDERVLRSEVRPSAAPTRPSGDRAARPFADLHATQPDHHQRSPAVPRRQDAAAARRACAARSPACLGSHGTLAPRPHAAFPAPGRARPCGCPGDPHRVRQVPGPHPGRDCRLRAVLYRLDHQHDHARSRPRRRSARGQGRPRCAGSAPCPAAAESRRLANRLTLVASESCREQPRACPGRRRSLASGRGLTEEQHMTTKPTDPGHELEIEYCVT
jgi:hypothetical protein